MTSLIMKRSVLTIKVKSCVLFMTRVLEQGETHQASMTVCIRSTPASYIPLVSTNIPREFAGKVLKSLYVDDFVGGDDCDDSVFEMYKNLKSSFSNGGLNMRKWVSNSAVLQEIIKDSEEQSPQVCQIESKSVEDPKIQDEDQNFSSSLFESAKNPSTEKLEVL